MKVTIVGRQMTVRDSLKDMVEAKLSKFDKFFGGNAEAAKKVGLALADKAKAAGIVDVVFDRSGYVYHGRVAALAEGAREGGLNF